MAKSVPTAITLPSLAELQAGRPVRLSTWKTLGDALHYIYGRSGAHVGGVVFDPKWQSLDYASGGSSYHQVGTETKDSTATFGLDRWTGVFKFSRLEYNSGNADQGYKLTLNVHANNLTVRATCIRLDTEDGNSTSTTSFTGLTTTHGADSEWQTGTLEFTPAQASRSGNTANGLAYFLVYVEALVPASGQGQIHQFALRESPITAATNLPRGA